MNGCNTRRGCSSTEVSSKPHSSNRGGTQYFCARCSCEVQGCSAPRNRGPLCYRHKDAMDNMGWELQMTRAIHRSPVSKGDSVAAAVAVDFLPCDVIALTSVCHLVTHSLSLALIVSAIKEPTAIKAFLALDASPAEATPSLLTPSPTPLADDAASLAAGLRRVWRALDGCPNEEEVRQLTRQGVGRFTGPTAVGRGMGVITPLPQGAKTSAAARGKDSTFALGLGKRPYHETGNGEVLRTFAIACAMEQDAWVELVSCTDLARVAKETRRLVRATGIAQLLWKGTHGASDAAKGPTAHKNQAVANTKGKYLHEAADDIGKWAEEGYVFDFLTRKLTLIVLYFARGVDWSKVPMTVLRAMSADSGSVLERVPDSWTAAELSATLFGRRDWGIFASMYGCLAHDIGVSRNGGPSNALKRKILADAQAGGYAERVAKFRQRHGTDNFDKVDVSDT